MQASVGLVKVNLFQRASIGDARLLDNPDAVHQNTVTTGYITSRINKTIGIRLVHILVPVDAKNYRTLVTYNSNCDG
jgi:hypothetical protein